MKIDYTYLLSSGVNASHLHNVQHFSRLRDAKDAIKQLRNHAWKLEKADLKRGNNLEISGLAEIDNSMLASNRETEAKRKAYCHKQGYKYKSQLKTDI
jgi:hypothetical protein